MTRAASSTSVSAAAVTGSTVIHWRTRASLECTRAAIAFSRSRSVRIPIRRAEVLDDDGADVLRRHPLGDLAEGVLGGDLDEVGAHDVGDLRHAAILSQAAPSQAAQK